MTDPAALVAELYALPTCGMGGPLHILLDDGNCADAHLDFCRDEVTGGQHYTMTEATPEDRGRIAQLSLAIIDALRPLSEAERERAVEAWL